MIFKTRVRNYMEEAKPDMPKEGCLASLLYEWKDVSMEDLFKEMPRENNSAPGPFEVSDCATMMKYLEGTASIFGR